MSTSTKIQIFQALSHIQQELLDVLVVVFVRVVNEEIDPVLWIFQLVDAVEEFFKERSRLLNEDAKNDLGIKYCDRDEIELQKLNTLCNIVKQNTTFGFASQWFPKVKKIQYAPKPPGKRFRDSSLTCGTSGKSSNMTLSSQQEVHWSSLFHDLGM